MDGEKGFSGWCVVQIMGHGRTAGFVTEQVIFGATLMRVDVPEVAERPGRYEMQPAIPAHTQFYGGSAIYRLVPCSEEMARSAAALMRQDPLSIYVPAPAVAETQRAIAGASDDWDINNQDSEYRGEEDDDL